MVADEVRSLSNRTQDSTQEIAQTVDNLQRVVGQSVTLMEEACSQADGDIGSVLAMGDELQNIVHSVQRVSDRLAQIATAAEQQAATADEVSGNIQQVDQAAGQLLDGAQAVSSAAEQLRLGSERAGAEYRALHPRLKPGKHCRGRHDPRRRAPGISGLLSPINGL